MESCGGLLPVIGPGSGLMPVIGLGSGLMPVIGSGYFLIGTRDGPGSGLMPVIGSGYFLIGTRGDLIFVIGTRGDLIPGAGKGFTRLLPGFVEFGRRRGKERLGARLTLLERI